MTAPAPPPPPARRPTRHIEVGFPDGLDEDERLRPHQSRETPVSASTGNPPPTAARGENRGKGRGGSWNGGRKSDSSSRRSRSPAHRHELRKQLDEEPPSEAVLQLRREYGETCSS